MSHILGLDSSTQSCSAIVIDVEQGSVIAESSVNFGEKLPQYNAPNGFIPDGQDGEVHSDPLMWLDALELLLSDLATQCDLSAIRAICGAGQQHGSVYLNASWKNAVQSLSTEQSLSQQIAPSLSRSTSPIWMDSSTGEECREIAETLGGDSAVCSKSGSIPTERFTGPQIRRFYKTNPSAYEQTVRIHLVSSFFASVLVGNDAAIDTGDGAGMNLLNISSWQWDDALLEATAPGLKEKLPEIKMGDAVVGNIAPYFIEKYGFAEHVPVTVFTGDNPSSLVGMGGSLPGKVVVSLGTSDTFFAALPSEADGTADPSGYGHVFGNPAGGAMSLQCFVNGSLARERVRERFGYDWDQLTEAFNRVPSGNEGNMMVPFFSPEASPRVSLPEPILKGSEEFEQWRNADQAMRACVEGQFVNMKLRTDWMQLQPEAIFLTGGASKNDAVAQVVADVFRAKVQRLAVSSSVALGAAMLAARSSLGKDLQELEHMFCQPDLESTVYPQNNAEVYAELAAEWETLF